MIHQSPPDFLKWAFGDNYGKFSSLECMYAWNKRHGDKLLIKEMDRVEDSLKEMNALYAEWLIKGEEFAAKVD